MNLEAAILEREHIAVSLEYGWEYLFLFGGILIASIHKAVFLATVAMEIAVKQYISLLLHSLYNLLCVIDSWVVLFVGVHPLTIEVH